MPTPLLFSNVTKHYGSVAVLRGVDLQISAAETVALIGVNGAGKSTLLKGLLDLTGIDSGHIKIFGTAHGQTAAREQIAYLSERFTPPYYANGNDILQFISRLHGARPTANEILDECAGLDLDAVALRRPAREYSKGMSQKLGLIACLLARRPLLIMDEPMSGLDPKARVLFKARLRRLKDDGVTIFFSTHLLDDVAQLCDRVAILDGGRIRFHGSIPDFQDAYRGATLEESFLHCIGSA